MRHFFQNFMAKTKSRALQNTHSYNYSSWCRKQFTRNIDINNSFCPYCRHWNTSQEMTNHQLIQSLWQNRNFYQEIIVKTMLLTEYKQFTVVHPNVMIIIGLTWWSWLQPVSPEENFVGWMGGWALSSCPPLLGFFQSPAPGSNNLWAYEPHTGCPCCSCTIAYIKFLPQWPLNLPKANEEQFLTKEKEESER